MTPPTQPLVTMRERFEERLARSVVGREAEQAKLDSIWTENASPLLWLWGLPGIGKTALLHAWSFASKRRGRRVAWIDALELEPSPEAFSTAVTDSLGQDPASVTGEPVVVVLDHYDAFKLLDGWLRERWVPALSAQVRLIIAAPTAPPLSWLAAPLGSLVDALELGALDRDAACSLLPEHAQPQRVFERVGGHPLALKLAATLSQHQLAGLDDPSHLQLMAELAQRFSRTLGEEQDRELVEICCVVRRLTTPLLAALLDVDDTVARERFTALTQLPFVRIHNDGVSIHPLVKEALTDSLRVSQPARYRKLRRVAYSRLQADLPDAPRSELWRCMADLLYMLDNPAVRRSFFPREIEGTSVTSLRESDEVRRIAQPHVSTAELDLLMAWAELAPSAFTLVGGPDAPTPARAFYAALAGGRVPRELVTRDPQLRAWLHDARSRPGGVQASLFVRRALDDQHGEQLCVRQAAIWLDIKKHYLELMPRLRHVYVGLASSSGDEAMSLLGFRDLGDLGVEVGAPALGTRLLDMGPGSVTGWLASLLEDELGEARGDLLQVQSRELTLPTGRVPLTDLETGVLAALLEKPGAAVTREALLQRVWGHGEHASTSNVVQAVVSGLRKKLGPYASCLTTLRGVGYRFEPPKR